MTDAPERKLLTPNGGLPTGNWKDADLIEYIRADLAKPKVKPLVWDSDARWRHIGRPLFKAAGWCFWIMQHNGSWRYMASKEEYPTIEAAKAAAQADYERRILEALENTYD